MSVMEFHQSDRNEDWLFFALTDGARTEKFLAESLGLKTESVATALEQLRADGLAVRTGDKWRRARRAERRRHQRALRLEVPADDTDETPTLESVSPVPADHQLTDSPLEMPTIEAESVPFESVDALFGRED